MARLAMSSDAGGLRQYSYSTRVVTETYTLLEALEKAGKGELNPLEVHGQLPDTLKSLVEGVSQDLFKKAFSSVSLRDQCSVMAELSKRVRAARDGEPRQMTVIEALRAAQTGEVDPVTLFPQLPEQLRNVLEAGAKAMCGSAFRDAPADTRRVVLAMIIDVLERQAAGASSPPAAETQAAPAPPRAPSRPVPNEPPRDPAQQARSPVGVSAMAALAGTASATPRGAASKPTALQPAPPTTMAPGPDPPLKVTSVGETHGRARRWWQLWA